VRSKEGEKQGKVCLSFKFAGGTVPDVATSFP